MTFHFGSLDPNPQPSQDNKKDVSARPVDAGEEAQTKMEASSEDEDDDEDEELVGK